MQRYAEGTEYKIEVKCSDTFDITQKINTAIKAKDLSTTTALILQYPLLAHNEINTDRQTALVLAAEANANDIVKFLLTKGVNVTHTDIKGLTALDYAVFHDNNSLYVALSEYQTKIKHNPYTVLINKLIKVIKNKITESVEDQENNYNQARNIIYLKLIEYLGRYTEDLNDPSKLLDLYILVNTVFRITTEAKDHDNFKNYIVKLFYSREELLCGDSNDYCYSYSLANQLSYSLAKYIFPDKNPTSILLEQAATKDRAIPWQNPYTLDTNLPESPSEFFRTQNNQIHLYEGIVEQAITQLKAGVKEKNKIWLTTDIKEIKSIIKESKEEKVNQYLSAEDLEIISQRSPTFKTLISYTTKLESIKLDEKKSLFDRFYELQQGLYKGSNESGYAKNSSYEAIARFSNWWNELSKSTQEKIINIDYKLRQFIQKTLYQYDYCTHIASLDIRDILAREDIRSALNKIDGTIEARVSDEQLDLWKSSILRELKQQYPIRTKKNAFADLDHLETFINWYKDVDSIDYKDLNLFVQILNSSPKNMIEKQKIINAILSCENMQILVTLYDFYNKTIHKEKDAIYYALLMKQYINSNLSLETLKNTVFYDRNINAILNELLYYFVKDNKINEVKYLLKLGADPTQADSQFKNLFIDVGFQCDIKSKITGFWSEAKIIERNGNSVLVHYESWNDIWDEWIDLNKSIYRFASYKTRSKSSEKEAHLPFDKVQFSLLDIAYKNKCIDIAIALTENNKISNQAFFYEINTKEDWKFVYLYFSQVKSNQINSHHLQDILNTAIKANQTDIIPILVSKGAKLFAANLAEVINQIRSPSMVSTLLSCDKNLINEEALLFGAATQNWACVLAYLNHRIPTSKTLFQILAYAVLCNQTDIVKATLLYLKNSFSTGNSYFASGFMCDVNVSGKWVPAQILNRDGDTIEIKYSGSKEEIINFHDFPERFAMYGSYSNKNHDKNYLLALENTTFPLFEIAFRNNNPEIAYMLFRESRIANDSQSILITAKSKEQWDFVRHYISMVKIDQFDQSFLQSLLYQAIKTRSVETISFLINLGTLITPKHLESAFREKQPSIVTSLLSKEYKLHNEDLLLSETDKGNWTCVHAYLNCIVPSNESIQYILRGAIKNNKPDILSTLLEKGVNPVDILLITKQEDQWRCLQNLIKKINKDNVPFNIDLPLDFNQKRSCAKDFVNYIIQKENNPYKLIKSLNTLFELELKTPLIIHRVGYWSTLYGHQWKKIPVSHAWAAILSNAKQKIVALLHNQTLPNDHDIVEFLNMPTSRLPTLFYRSRPSSKETAFETPCKFNW